MKFGLLPAKIQSIVNTNAARPKMTGMSAVDRSIFADLVWTVFESTAGRMIRNFCQSQNDGMGRQKV